MSAVRCPKCGGAVKAERAGKLLKGFCVTCGREVWACPKCGFASFSYRGVAGHMKTHQLHHRLIIRDPARLSEILNLDNQLIIKGMKALARSSIDDLLDNQRIINLLLLAAALGLASELSALSARLEALEEAVRAAAARPAPKGPARAPPPVRAAEVADEGLPSFARGNPWLGVIARRGGEGEARGP